MWTRPPSRSSSRACSTSTATTRTRRPSLPCARLWARPARPTHYLAIPPSLFAGSSSSSARSGCAAGARVVIEKPFGHDLASARALNAHPPHRLPGGVGLPHRPLPRQGGRGEPPLLPLRQHVPRADLESQLRGVRADHDGGAVRRRRAGASSTTKPGRSATSIQNHLLQVVGYLAMEPPQLRRVRSDARRAGQGVPGHPAPSSPATSSAVSSAATAKEPGVAAGSTTETFAAVRLEIDSWRWERRALPHPGREVSPA